jgi:hypothetical protein
MTKMDDQEPRRAILKQTIDDALNNVKEKGVEPTDANAADLVHESMAKFGAPEDAAELISKLQEQGSEKLIEQLRRGDSDQAFVNLALIDKLEEGGKVNNQFLIAASESPIDCVSMCAVTALSSLKSQDAAAQMGKLIVRPGLEREILSAALSLVESAEISLGKPLRKQLESLKSHKDPEIRDTVERIFEKIESTTTKAKMRLGKLISLFAKDAAEHTPEESQYVAETRELHNKHKK